MFEKESERIEYAELKDGDIFWSSYYNCLLKLVFYDSFIGYYCRRMDEQGGVVLRGESPIYKCPPLLKVLL